MLVMTSKSENKKSARSLRVPWPDTMVTRSCLIKVRSAVTRLINPSINASSSFRVSRSVQLIFIARSCTSRCASCSSWWSGCEGSVCFSSVYNNIYIHIKNVYPHCSKVLDKYTYDYYTCSWICIYFIFLGHVGPFPQYRKLWMSINF